MTAVDELIAFVRAQLDEDERLANEQREFDAMVEAQRDPGAVNAVLMPPLALPGAPGDPDRALAEVEAKRRILGARDEAIQDARRNHNEPGFTAAVDAYDYAVQLLAQPYAGREGWREEWAV